MAEGGFISRENNRRQQCFHCESVNEYDNSDPSLICDFCHAFIYAELTQLEGDSGDSGNEDADSISGDSASNNDEVSDMEAGVGPDLGPPVANQPQIPPVSRKKLGELAESIPPEVLLVIFSYLDDLSKWACSRVNRKWATLMESMLSDNDWRGFVGRRWPLFQPKFKVSSYRDLYSRIVQSSFCFRCLGVDLFTSASSTLRRSRNRERCIRPLWAEVRCLRNDAPDGIAALPLVDNRTVWTASIIGPVGSPYEGGLFFLSIRIPVNYPILAPRVIFLTRIFHPNVSLHGDIGIDLFSRQKWSVAVSLSKLLISIQSLLTDPYPEMSMHPEAGALYLRDLESFNKTAREWTWRYAMVDYLPGLPPLADKMNSPDSNR